MSEDRGGFPQCCQEPTQCSGCTAGLPAVVNLTMTGWALNATYNSGLYGPNCLTAADFNDTFELPVGYSLGLLGTGFGAVDTCSDLGRAGIGCGWADDFASLVSSCGIGKECRFIFDRTANSQDPLECKILLLIKTNISRTEVVEFKKVISEAQAADCCNWNLSGWTVERHEVIGNSDPDALMLDSSGASATVVADNSTCNDLDPGGCNYYNPGVKHFNVSLDAFHDGPDFTLSETGGASDHVVYGTSFNCDQGTCETIDDTANGSIQGDVKRYTEDVLFEGAGHYDLNNLGLADGEEITLFIRHRVGNTGNDPSVWFSGSDVWPPAAKFADLAQGATYAANGDTLIDIGGTDYDFKNLGTFNWNESSQRYIFVLSGNDTNDNIYLDAIVVRRTSGTANPNNITPINTVTRPTSGQTDTYSDGCAFLSQYRGAGEFYLDWPWSWREFFTRDCDSGPDPVISVGVAVRWYFCGNGKFRYDIKVISTFKIHWCWTDPLPLEGGVGPCNDTNGKNDTITHTQDVTVEVVGDQSNPIAVSFSRPAILDSSACDPINCFAGDSPEPDDPCLNRYSFAVSQLTLTPVMV